MKLKKENGKNSFLCGCGYKTKDLGDKKIVESITETKPPEIVEQEVVALPVVDADCTKCSNKKAYFWTIQTRASDEPETKFYRCVKCKHTWRDYS
ncbi:transcription factor S [Candidatus Woesearchaeota archaeon]|nr:transcription factor S [Candidatus Woesearchaeota archaeon]